MPVHGTRFVAAGYRRAMPMPPCQVNSEHPRRQLRYDRGDVLYGHSIGAYSLQRIMLANTFA